MSTWFYEGDFVIFNFKMWEILNLSNIYHYKLQKLVVEREINKVTSSHFG
jgi:hypothetical protein